MMIARVHDEAGFIPSAFPLEEEPLEAWLRCQLAARHDVVLREPLPPELMRILGDH